MDRPAWDGTERRSTRRDGLVADIAQAVRDEIAGLTVPEELHREHHEFIREWIEERRRKRERSDKVRAQVEGWLIVSLLGAIGTGAYHLFQTLREHWK